MTYMESWQLSHLVHLLSMVLNYVMDSSKSSNRTATFEHKHFPTPEPSRSPSSERINEHYLKDDEIKGNN